MRLVLLVQPPHPLGPPGQIAALGVLEEAVDASRWCRACKYGLPLSTARCVAGSKRNDRMPKRTFTASLPVPTFSSYRNGSSGDQSRQSGDRDRHVDLRLLAGRQVHGRRFAAPTVLPLAASHTSTSAAELARLAAGLDLGHHPHGLARQRRARSAR